MNTAFPANTADGKIVNIVEKGHADKTQTELFIDEDGKKWTRGFQSGGNDAHTLVPYDEAADLKAHSDDDANEQIAGRSANEQTDPERHGDKRWHGKERPADRQARDVEVEKSHVHDKGGAKTGKH